MTRIDRPGWAREPDVWLSDFRLADYYRIQEHREIMLRVVQDEVEAYLNTPDLYYEGRANASNPQHIPVTLAA
jgi:hypothetical protein